MRRMLNKLTGAEMWVADSRVKEYIAAGHSLAASLDAALTKTEPEEAEAKDTDITPDTEPEEAETPEAVEKPKEAAKKKASGTAKTSRGKRS